MRSRVLHRVRWSGVAALLVATFVSVPQPASASAMITFGATSDAAGTVTLRAVACNTTSLCVALGENETGSAWYEVTIRHGVARNPHLIAGAKDMTDIACSDAHNCIAVGDHVVAIVDGVAGAPQTAPLTSGVACPTASQCYAVGGANIVSIVNGTVVGTSTTTNFTTLNDVSCLSAAVCIVIGNNPFPPGLHLYNDAYAVMTNGVIGTASVLRANQDATFFNVTCTPPAHCYIGGSVLGASSEAVRLNLVEGVLSQSRVIDETNFDSPEIDSATCLRKMNLCAYSAVNSIVLTNLTGTFDFVGGANLPSATTVWSLACPSAAACIAVGEHPDTSNPGSDVGFVQSFSIT